MPSGPVDHAGQRVLGRLLRQARPFWPRITGVFALDFLATPLSLLAPLPLKIAVDSALGTDPLPPFISAITPAGLESSSAGILALAALLVLAIAVLAQLQRLASSILSVTTGERLVMDFRARLFRHAQRLSLSYHDTKGTFDSVYRILYDAQSIQSVAVYGPPLINAGFTVLGMLYVSFLIDWQLAAAAAAVVPALVIITLAHREPIKRQWREMRRLQSSAYSVPQESLGALRVVKTFGQEQREETRFIAAASNSIKAYVRVLLTKGRYNLLTGLVIGLGTASVLYLGVRHVQAGTLTLGALLVVMAYVAQLFGPLRSIGNQVTNLQDSLVMAERTFALLDQAPDVAERVDAVPLERARGDVAFDRVAFGYEERRSVLAGVSFSVPAGARVGIAGETGAGKSTLVNLLIRLCDPDEGRILLDGRDVRDFRIRDLRRQYGVVLQDTILFSTSVAENIAYARPRASFEEIVEAAKAANAHPFIEQLPNGYETLVGERGMLVSGGERQRISLARAFLKDAPVLILDEPTSAVDTATETLIMEAMERLMKGRTTFMIAHRLSTLSNCDLLLVVENGAVTSVRSADVGSQLARLARLSES